MNTKTGRCCCCESIVWEGSLSLRGWCIACESEFRRVTEQREARRVLQKSLFPDDPE